MLDKAVQDEAARLPMLKVAVQDEATMLPMLDDAVQDEATRPFLPKDLFLFTKGKSVSEPAADC